MKAFIHLMLVLVIMLTSLNVQSDSTDPSIDESQAAQLGASGFDSHGDIIDSQAAFFAQIIVSGKIASGGAFSNRTPLQIKGRLRPAPEDIGLSGEPIIVVLYEGLLYMKTPDGWKLWGGALDTLEAAEPALLQTIEDLDIVSDLALPGSFNLFIGYRADGRLHHAKNALQFRIIDGVIDESLAQGLNPGGITDEGLPFDSRARFFAQLYADGQAVTSDALKPGQTVDIFGRFHVAGDDVGQAGEILRVARYQGDFYMKTPGGWVPWDGQLSSLVAAEAPHVFQPVEDIDIERNLNLPGSFEVFFGYRSQGRLHYTESPLLFTLHYRSDKLNDTGITVCADGTTDNLACPVANFPGQDAQHGRDVTHDDDSDGHAGFSFTKLDGSGSPLPADALQWDCVMDNVTGLIWEVKTDDGGLRDRDNTYTWYEADNSKNGGDQGVQNGGVCTGSACDTYAYVQAVNAQGLCGASDWRMPTVDELLGIAVLDRTQPAIDTLYFPNTPSSWFWSSSPDAGNGDLAQNVNFYYGNVYWGFKHYNNQVRLVRSGQ